jgi:uncharacterized protein
MGLLQIDTIQVVARSPYLVLWSRLGRYPPAWLDEQLAAGRLFEYWAHEACFIPIEHYPLHRHTMIDPGSLGWKYSHDWIEANRAVVERVRDRLRAEGPLRSADFERKDGRKGGGWWSWKPEKRALEMLFSAGEVMVARRERFQRVYDLRERVLPDWDEARLPPLRDARRELAEQAVRALGITRADWVADYHRLPRREMADHVHDLAAEGRLLRVEVEGWKEPGYAHPHHAPLLERAAAGRLHARRTTLLSPFDPIVWDRRRLRGLWDFEYALECYTPAAKRRWGYFVLPILRAGRLIGRLDAKAHRRAGRMEIRSLHLEGGVRPSERMAADVARALRDFAAWHETPEVDLGRRLPSAFRPLLRGALSRIG